MSKTPKLTPDERRAYDYADSLLNAGLTEAEVAFDLQNRGWDRHFSNALRKLGVVTDETVH